MNWYEYQEAVADIFRSIGAEVETNYKTSGARGDHNLDVWVRVKQFGIQVIWICECKLWRSPIPKEKVLTLYEITKDLGVDRGFLFSESGFQAGAIRCSEKTSITLTSIDEIKSLIQEELQESLLINYLRQIALLKKNLKSAWIDDLGHPIVKNNIDFDKCLLIDGTLMFTTLQIQKAINKDFPIFITTLSKGNLECRDLEELNKTLSEELYEIESHIIEIIQRKNHRLSTIETLKNSFLLSINELLISSEKQLFGERESIDRQVMETLKCMKSVGENAKNLKIAATGSLSIEVHKMMRLLIDFVYPHLTKIDMNFQEWEEAKKIIIEQVKVTSEK